MEYTLIEALPYVKGLLNGKDKENIRAEVETSLSTLYNYLNGNGKSKHLAEAILKEIISIISSKGIDINSVILKGLNK